MAEISHLKANEACVDDKTGDRPLISLIEELFPREWGKRVQLRKRRFLYHQGEAIDAVWCLISGVVALQRLDEEGRMAIFGMMKAGTALAWQDLLGGRTHHCNSAETLAVTEVIGLPRALFCSTLQSDPRLLKAIMRQAAAQVGAYEEHMLRLSTLEVPQRLYSTLCAMASPPAAQGDTVELSMPLLRRDLAALIGTSPEGVSRGIRRLEEMDVAEFSGRNTVRLKVPPRR